ncbi:expressed protein [Pseudozyma hubeiensis SY62]|uniref:Expressed protein n=1 Tax=Pseudozyma hubeiensis (strain SY62) TaxID=1305764 RepID=R9P5X6_PSEHS|nr:expressed protein [Pseudozyma hubeiensis SY62]GAC96803.1 expressed protein [Pseudozyma hubeiensis SY62]
MASTPSPSKRPRIPTSSAVASATASPFTASTSRPSGPRSVGPSGTSANPAPIIGLGMSPMDTYSPAPGTSDAYGISGFTPYSTTSPAYAAGGLASAASPISAALAHGSRVLSNIQASSPFFHNNGATPMLPQHGYARYPPLQSNLAIAQQGASTSQPGTTRPQQTSPQQGSPEYLRLALHHLQTTLLAKLESEAEAFFDAADSALALTADSRIVAGKARAFQGALDGVLEYVEKNGLASIPLLPLPEAESKSAETTGEDDPPKQSLGSDTAAVDTNKTTDPKATAPAEPSATKTETSTASAAPSLQSHIDRLQLQARQLFDQRQRLKESASIVGAILDS